VEVVEQGVRRITFALPLGIDHVHCYLLRASTGGWILVDTGLGSRDPETKWRPVLDELDAPIEQIVVTHMHPDHVGGARDVAELTGAPVLQGREDYAQCVSAWGADRSLPRLAGWWESHGLPPGQAEAMRHRFETIEKRMEAREKAAEAIDTAITLIKQQNQISIDERGALREAQREMKADITSRLDRIENKIDRKVGALSMTPQKTVKIQ